MKTTNLLKERRLLAADENFASACSVDALIRIVSSLGRSQGNAKMREPLSLAAQALPQNRPSLNSVKVQVYSWPACVPAHTHALSGNRRASAPAFGQAQPPTLLCVPRVSAFGSRQVWGPSMVQT